MNSTEVIEALSAIAHPHRLATYRLLVQVGKDGLAAGDIASQLDIPSPSLSFHLSHLQRANVIHQRRESRSLIYSANFDLMNSLIRFLTDNCCNGTPCTTEILCHEASII
jgi:ArsR family transcriptional regulator, arsenate/arsenite/antimonite-responsive transcriptional repressor